jgi:glycosyltransferase involved in cell wall biosynthesis
MKRGISISGIGAVRKMAKIFRQEKFDLVQYSTPNASLYASLAAKLSGVPVRLYCQWGIAYVGFHGWKRRIFKTVEKLVCSLSTWVEPDSFGNLSFCRSEGLYKEDKSSVIWNGSACGVSLKKFDSFRKPEWRKQIRSDLGIGEDAFVYGFVGRITGDKGNNELFAAYRKLLGVRENTYLLLVGGVEKPDSLNPELYTWAQKNPRVLFCPYSLVIEQYFSAMDVYILPSYREGFGSAVVEAEVMGVPVIVTDIPGPTDAMQEDRTGLIVEKADVDALYEAMLRLKDDRALLERFGAAARSFAVESFEQTKLFEHILKDRKRLLGEKAGS